MKRPKGVTFLGYSFMLMAIQMINGFVTYPEMAQKIGLLAQAVTNLLVFVTLCVSLLTMQSWSRWLCIAVCALSLLLVPSIVVEAHGNWLTLIRAGLRTLFCVWGVWYLSQPHVKAAFRNP